MRIPGSSFPASRTRCRCDARLEHLDILNSLLDKDTERAIALMQSHIENCRKATLDYFCSIQTYMDSPSLTYKNQLARLWKDERPSDMALNI